MQQAASFGVIHTGNCQKKEELIRHGAIGYTTRNELPPGVIEMTLIVVPSNLQEYFENVKWYLLAINNLLIVQKVDKVIFGKELGKFKLVDWNGEVDLLGSGGIIVWRIIWKIEELR